MGWEDVSYFLEPPGAEGIQDMTFQGDRAPGDIESRLAIGGNEKPGIGRLSVNIPDFALLPGAKEGKIRVLQRTLQKGGQRMGERGHIGRIQGC